MSGDTKFSMLGDSLTQHPDVAVEPLMSTVIRTTAFVQQVLDEQVT